MSSTDERQRLQFAFLNLIQGGTWSRPGALVSVKRDKQLLKQHYINWENDSSDEGDDSMDLDLEDTKTI